MKKLIFLFLISITSIASAQTFVRSTAEGIFISRADQFSTGSLTITSPMYFDRTLTTDERQALTESQEFRQQCYWAISNYATYWKAHDGSGLNTTERAKWRREYELVKQVARADYNDASLALRFVMLSKGMSFAVDADPTTEEIIALFIADSKFEELASLYFDLMTE